MRSLSIAAVVVLVAAAKLAFATPSLESYTLRNGLRVILTPDPDAASADVSVCYAAGAAWERAGQRGLSHLYERMLVRATRQFGPGEAARQLVAAGGRLNSSSNPDGTTLWQSVPPEALDLALRIEADRMTGAALDPAALEAEKRAAQDERRARFERGIPRALRRLYASLFPGHPYGRRMDEQADVAKLTVRDVAAWGRARFAPNTATLIVAGRFDAPGARTRIERLFGVLPGRGDANPPRPSPLPAISSAPVVERGDDPVPVLIAGWRGPAASDPDAPAFELIARLLASGSSARLERALVRDSTAALDVQANAVLQREASVLWTLVRLRPGADSAYVERTLLAEVRRLALAPPEADELERARRPFVLNEYLLRQTPRQRATVLADAVAERGDAAAAEARLEALVRVQPADVQRTAQRFLASVAPAIVWLPAVGTEARR